MVITEQAQPKKLFYGWIIVGTAFAVVFLHLSIRSSFAVFLKPMCQDLGWTTAKVSVGLSLFMLFYGINSFVAGKTTDKYGPRKVIFLHGILLGLGLFLASFALKPWQFYFTYGVMGGTGAGALWVPPTSMVRKWFIKDMGKAMGFTSAGCGLAYFLGPILSMYLIEYMSWQFAMRAFGVIVMIGIPLAAMFMKGSPEEIDEKPLGYEEAERKANSSGTGSVPEVFPSLAEALRTPAFWIISLMWLCSTLAESIVFSHSVNYVITDRGFDLTTASYLFSLIGLSFLVAGQVGGSWADKLGEKLNDDFKGRKQIVTAAYLAASLASVWLIFVKTPGMYLAYAILFGIPYGIYIPNVVAYVGTIFGRKSMGAIWGLTTTIGVAGGAGIGPFIGGILRDLTGTYQASIGLSCAAYALAGILCFAVQKPGETVKLKQGTVLER